MSNRLPRVSACALCIVLCLLAVGTAWSAAAAEVLFTSPLHITRELTNPVTESKSVVDEYCHGNRVVAVSDRKTAIADYAKGELTTIDFTAGTYSVTKFTELAKINTLRSRSPESQPSSDSVDAWKIARRGGAVVASRPGDVVEVERKDASAHRLIYLTVDRQLALSQEAVEALLGIGYPNYRDDAADAVMNALRPEHRVITNATNATSRDEYFLPLEYDITYEVAGETLKARNIILRIGNELPPPDVLAIPPGAKRVESAAVEAQRALEALDGAAAPRR